MSVVFVVVVAAVLPSYYCCCCVLLSLTGLRGVEASVHAGIFVQRPSRGYPRFVLFWGGWSVSQQLQIEEEVVELRSNAGESKPRR